MGLVRSLVLFQGVVGGWRLSCMQGWGSIVEWLEPVLEGCVRGGTMYFVSGFSFILFGLDSDPWVVGFLSLSLVFLCCAILF